MLYKNVSIIPKTFHGVTIEPGEIKEIPGYVNNRGLIAVYEMPKEPPKSVEPKKQLTAAKQESSKQEAPKKQESKQESKNNNKEESQDGSNSN